MTREEAAEQIYGLILSADDEDGPCIFSDQIEALETAIEVLKQPEWKKGKWIKNEFYENALQCSNCHAYLDKEDLSRHYFYFCYHCGAFMEGMETEDV